MLQGAFGVGIGGVLHQCVALLDEAKEVITTHSQEQATKPHLDVASPSIQVEMEVEDLAIVRESILHIVFGGFFVNICDHHNPTLNSFGKQSRVGHNRDIAVSNCEGL